MKFIEYLQLINESKQPQLQMINEGGAAGHMPHIFENFKLWYQPISEKFWQWVRTLPYYNSTILYSITMNETFLKEI
jgi:hypothetical protein